MIKNKYLLLLLSFLLTFSFTACDVDNSDDYIQKDTYVTNMQSNTTIYLNLKTGIPTDGETPQYSDGVYTLTQAPANGKITLDGDILSYTPNSNYIGTDEIKLEDGEEDYVGYRKITIEITVTENTGTSSSTDTESNTCTSGTCSGSTTSELSILGTPSKSISSGEKYSFVPYVINDSEKSIHFHISNKPSWITLDSTTGEISGIAPNVDKTTLFENIGISVGTDEDTHASLSPFTIEVTP